MVGGWRLGFGAFISGRILNQSRLGKHQICLRWGSLCSWSSVSNRVKASYLRTFEDATFISIRELPPHAAQVLEGGIHRRSESLGEEEMPYQRMSGERWVLFLGLLFQRFWYPSVRTLHDILGLVEAETGWNVIKDSGSNLDKMIWSGICFAQMIWLSTYATVISGSADRQYSATNLSWGAKVWQCLWMASTECSTSLCDPCGQAPIPNIWGNGHFGRLLQSFSWIIYNLSFNKSWLIIHYISLLAFRRLAEKISRNFHFELVDN